MIFKNLFRRKGRTILTLLGIAIGVAAIVALGAMAEGLREGFTAADDRLPKRVRIAFDSGPIKGSGISDEDFAWFKHHFYQRMDWDPESGRPTDDCLRSLGLDRLLKGKAG